MSKRAIFITHRALPGKRDQVRGVWERHLRPVIESNPGHEAYFYCYDDEDADVVRVYQQYSDATSQEAFLGEDAYALYEEEVAPLLAAPPDVRLVTPWWTKEEVATAPVE